MGQVWYLIVSMPDLCTSLTYDPSNTKKHLVFLKNMFLKITMVACLVECNSDILCDFGSCVRKTSSAESMILNDVNTFQSHTGYLASWHLLCSAKKQTFYITYSFLSNLFVY